MQEIKERDRQCIVATLNGNTESFGTLVQAYQERVFGFLFKMTLSREDAEELTQEVFVRAYNYLYRVDLNGSFSSWLFKIALNTFKTHHRRKKRDAIPSSEWMEELQSSDAGPEFRLETKERYNEVVNAIYHLKSEQRSAFLLRHIQGCSFGDIANIMSISVDAARMKVQRAKEKILEQLRRYERRANQ